MAGGFGYRTGGILGLYDFLEKHREAIDYDLLVRGFHSEDLGTARLSWYDLHVLIKRWLKTADTATSDAVNGQVWSIDAQIMAMAVDVLQIANWQRAGKKTAPRPKPLPRPWLKPKGQQLGRDPIPISQFNDWWSSQARK